VKNVSCDTVRNAYLDAILAVLATSGRFDVFFSWRALLSLTADVQRNVCIGASNFSKSPTDVSTHPRFFKFNLKVVRGKHQVFQPSSLTRDTKYRSVIPRNGYNSSTGCQRQESGSILWLSGWHWMPRFSLESLYSFSERSWCRMVRKFGLEVSCWRCSLLFC
jgi:hypothetical protein